MSDEKKNDDFKLDLGDDRRGESFNAIPLAPRSPTISPARIFRPENQGILSVISYCMSSIIMTTANKFVLSSDYNLNFFLLAVQVCSIHSLYKYLGANNIHSLLCVSQLFKLASHQD
jgi:GDP-mannose transporter